MVKEEPICRLRLVGCTIKSTTADHIIPRSRRPDLTYVRSNLRGACVPCNMRRGDRPESELARLRQTPPKNPPPALGFFE